MNPPASRARRAAPCAALLAAAAVVPVPARGDTCAGIRAVYDQLNAAFVQGDVARVLSYCTPDYTDVDPKGGTRNRDEARRHYQDERRQVKTMHSRYTVQVLDSTDAGTLVEFKMHTDGTGEKRILFAKFHGTFTNDLLVRDFWVDTPQGWRLKHRQTLLDETRTHPG